MDKNFGMAIICTALSLLCFIGTASATTWSVDGSGGANFTRIQDAINTASACDMILVYSGVYNENVVVDKSVTLRGIGQPVVDAAGNAITLRADRITVEGFNLTNSRIPGGGVGIKVIPSNNTITGNNVCYNSSTDNNVCNNNDDGI